MRGTKGLNDVLGPLSLAWQTPGGSLDDVSLEVVRQFALNVLEAKRIWETYWTAELALWSFWSLLALAVGAFLPEGKFDTDASLNRLPFRSA